MVAAIIVLLSPRPLEEAISTLPISWGIRGATLRQGKEWKWKEVGRRKKRDRRDMRKHPRNKCLVMALMLLTVMF